ncbi:hypothetical protein [Granulicella arctica]|uniref:Chromosome segregation ATPase n=1 Tax=Granulicella arctica TaxID=940613 RepID=A0A7Y9PG63_9BACT|nr:hypothetical protein [Granulicella arctica]NYF79095.1 chromosome segregation ATPase [Granulicella arctica]
MLHLAPETHGSLFTAYGALLVAFVAGAFSLLGLTVAKENKVSEFRQEWINALREDIAEFIAQAQLIHSEISEYVRGECADYRDHLDRTRDPYLDLNRASTRIKLRLNLAEEDNKTLMNSMGELQDILRTRPDNIALFQTQFGPASKNVEIQTSLILAKEWKRVKAGETGYKRARRIALVVLSISLLAVVISLFC